MSEGIFPKDAARMILRLIFSACLKLPPLELLTFFRKRHWRSKAPILKTTYLIFRQFASLEQPSKCCPGVKNVVSYTLDDLPFEVIKLFSCSTKVGIKFFLLVNIRMPTIVSILIFMSRKKFILCFAGKEFKLLVFNFL